MKKEQKDMKNVVKTVLQRRANENLSDPVLVDNDLKNNFSSAFISSHIKQKVHSCPVCEREFPSQSQLLGKITFRAVLKWKIDHKVVIPKGDHRMDSNRLADCAHLCIFCTQFFDKNGGNNLIDPLKFNLNYGDKSVEKNGNGEENTM
jgi:hypothetical protein